MHVAVSGSRDRTLRIWGLTRGTQLGQPLTGRDGSVNAVACTILDDKPIVVTVGGDKTVRTWNLVDRQKTSPFALPFSASTVAFAGEALIVGYGKGVARFDYFPPRRNP